MSIDKKGDGEQHWNTTSYVPLPPPPRIAVEGNGGSTPKQYGLPEDARELQDLINYRNMNFAMGNIFKAVYRMGIKNDAMYELNKIIFNAQAEIDRIKKYGDEGTKC